MALIVQKYGGTSVESAARIRSVAGRVARARRAGSQVVVVVSAMGHTTDELLARALEIAPDARRRHPRELDMLLTAGERIAMALLAMAIREEGVEAVSLTGSQAAIITDAAHTVARIEEIRATRIREELAAGRVAIVAGFQGVSRTREVTTLGRGGSDTTAVALAAALGADRCEIYTDVDGVYTADPRRVPEARRIRRLDYEEMLELAYAGAQVMHHRAVEIGARHGVPIRVLSSFGNDDDEGTLIARKEPGMEDLALTGLAFESGYARLVFHGLAGGLYASATVLTRMAEAGVSLDIVTQADLPGGTRQLQLSFRNEYLEAARSVAEVLVAELGGGGYELEPGLARVALVGSGMHGRPGVYARAFQTLLEADIDIHGLSTSNISIALLVREADMDAAAGLLHAVFRLGEGGA
jgi:aspartate kinase